MNDRELLELAAKAAQISLIDWGENWAEFGPGYRYEDADGMRQAWNPLTDDGDALRLAVKLGICVVFMEDHDSVCAEHSKHGVMIIEAMDNFGTRRAIVRAAAQIGQSM